MADTASQRRQGLRGVESFPGDIEGMLFVFETPTTATFGMRDTLIPLDIWWFDPDGGLIGSAQMQPCVTSPCTGFGSPGEISWALETPAGTVQLAPGDQLSVDHDT